MSTNESIIEKSVEKYHKKKIKILLLTHTDSDNLGDQMIEICDFAILQTIMKNLGYKKSEYEVISERAAIIPTDYGKNKSSELLKPAKKLIKTVDLVILGGAPQFNYIYQYFSERSVAFIKIAQKYNKPIIFSAIGIENYDPTHPKCQSLKRALKYDCVKMVTTRDNLPDLKKLVTNENVRIAHVADPAVVSGQVMRNFKSCATNKIGLFVIRGKAFADNNIDFSSDDAAKMWLALIDQITARGYDYELITSGHYSDEQFIDLLIRKYKVPNKKCVFTMHTPENLISKISSYAGIISCRLHPSIISYSLKVPSVGIVWNPKVTGFYNSVHYSDRAIPVETSSPEIIVDKLEDAIREGVEHDKTFITSIYNSLFNEIKSLFCKNNHAVPYDYNEIMKELPVYEGTSPKEADQKLTRKTRRCYRNFNSTNEKLENMQKQNTALKQKYDLLVSPVQVRYYSQGVDKNKCLYSEEGESVTIFSNKGYEYTAPSLLFHNSGKDRAAKMGFERDGMEFLGWNVRVRSHSTWFWLLTDGTLCMRGNQVWTSLNQHKYIVKDEGVIPVIPLKYIDSIVLEAVWQ